MEGRRFGDQRSLSRFVWPPDATLYIRQYVSKLGLGSLAAPAFLGGAEGHISALAIGPEPNRPGAPVLRLGLRKTAPESVGVRS